MRRLSDLKFIAVSALFISILLTPQVQAEDAAEITEVTHLTMRTDSLLNLRQLDSAVIIGKQALKKAQKVFGESDTTVAQICHLLGKCYYFQADYTQCESLWNTALSIREEVMGPDHPEVARSLNNLATLFSDRGDYAKAESLHSRALSIREKALDADDPEIAQSLNNLAILLWRVGKYSEAEPLYRRALSITEKARGSDHPDLAYGLINLAILYQDKGKYRDAEPLCKRAVDITTQSLGNDHPYVATSLVALANICEAQGRSDEARSLYKQALAIWEKVLGPDHPRIAISLDNLAVLYADEGRYAEAEQHHNRALEIREKAMGSDHPDVARSLDNLAVLKTKQSQYAEAELLQKRALAIWEKSLGSEHPLVALCLTNLADLYQNQGMYDKAESLHQRALRIRENSLGLNHPDIARTLMRLAILYGTIGETDKGSEYFERVQQSRQNFVDYVFAYASEDQKMRYIEEYPLVNHFLLSYALITGSDDLRNSALEMILKSKATVIDAVAAEKKIAFCSMDDEIRAKAEKHAEICGEISTVTLVGAEKLEPQTYLGRLRDLYVIKDSLEAELSGRCAQFKNELAAVKFTVADVSDALSPNAVLWEYVKYNPYDFNKIGSDGERTGSARYIAFVLTHNETISLIDLGDAAVIDSLVGLARNQIYRARAEVFSPRVAESERRLSNTTGRLYDIIFAPLASDLSPGADIFISPDGQLNLLPYEILTCPDAEYVIEKYEISYLSSGRDLLGHGAEPKPGNRAVILADPDFDFWAEASTEDDGTVSGGVDTYRIGLEPFRGVSGCINNRFDPLPYTREEAVSIARMLGDKADIEIDSYFGESALEDVLKELSAPPRLLHLATHGYFCEDLDLLKNEMLENPLLRSGMALAGANHIMNDEKEIDGEDGILTAFEVSGLNLLGTELVTLSACESGVGQVKTGEGVYGLRRAFQHAGAGTILMSLWKVPDKETHELMNDFYENWTAGLTKKAALRTSALNVLKKCREKYKAAHPLLWGGFVLAGNPE